MVALYQLNSTATEVRKQIKPNKLDKSALGITEDFR